MHASSTANDIADLLAPYRQYWAGNPYCQTLCFSSDFLDPNGEVAQALQKAFAAMDYGQESLGFLVCPTHKESAPWDFDTARWCLEVFDPLVVIAIDAGCLPFVSYLVQDSHLQVGQRSVRKGRGYVVLENFALALTDPELKRVAWRQMRALEKGRF